jgi:hypothetical protein
MRVALGGISVASLEAPRWLGADTLQKMLVREWQLATAIGDRQDDGLRKNYSISAAEKAKARSL